MKIFYTFSAVNDLEFLYDFVAKNNPKAAFEIKNKLQQAIKRLNDFPLLGREIKNNSTSSSLREIITSHYIIRYLLLNNEIHILRIWHGKEDREKMFIHS